MKLRDKTLIVTSLALIAVTLLLIKKDRDRKEQMRASIADEGYELAQDILFPLKSNRARKMYFGHGN